MLLMSCEKSVAWCLLLRFAASMGAVTNLLKARRKAYPKLRFMSSVLGHTRCPLEDHLESLLHRLAQLLQRGPQLLRLIQHAGEEIAHSVEPPQNVGNVELRRLQSRHNFFPFERRGHRRAGVGAENVRR